MCAAITAATGSAAAELQRRDQLARDAVVRQRRPGARERRARRRAAAPVRRQPAAAAHARRAATAARACTRRTAAGSTRASGTRHAAQAGGTTRASSSETTRTITPEDAAAPRHGTPRDRTIVRRASTRARARRHLVDLRAGRDRVAARLRGRVRPAVAHGAHAEGGARAAGWGRAALWATGIALLFVALISPDRRARRAVRDFHMVQHLLIADLAPIALTLALTKWILRPATRRIHWIERGGRAVRAPGVRRRRLRRRDVGVARPRALRRGARARA